MQNYREMVEENAANGLGLHVETLMLCGASLAQLLDIAARATVLVAADDAPVSSVNPTIPAKAA